MSNDATSNDASFPRSPIREFDPFGKSTGVNPFSEANSAEAAGQVEPPNSDNIYASSSALAEPAPQIEYDAVLEPRLIVISSSFGVGLCLATVATLMFVLIGDSIGEGLGVYGILFVVALAFFVGASLTSQFDLQAMRKGAMKRTSEGVVRGIYWSSWLGGVYCLALVIFSAWAEIEYYFWMAFGR
jgi:hypothetical protein